MSGLLLDTHVWLWLVNGESALSAGSRRALESAALAGGLAVAAISVWEVGRLEAQGRIRLLPDCAEWVRRSLAGPECSLVPLSPEVAIAASRLPGQFHGDPADRILAATARQFGMTLATADRQILAYSDLGHVRTLKAR
ncbi:MAG: type II toxin-antitoxin system VapC family toxin [Planctomycetes bacterium]|nr:type II toxin-antitoxin system VapC family toxin [Planctomycetota bacterium]